MIPNKVGGEILVEKQLTDICTKLALKEANIKLFVKMSKKREATKEVMGFILNQAMRRKTQSGATSINKRLIRVMMRQKLQDICSQMNQLTHRRWVLRKKVMGK